MTGRARASRPRSGSRLRPERNDTMANLPAEFAELERFIDWALPSETERYDKRLASTMDELQDFYDTAFPILENSTEYLKSVSLADISDEETNLLRIFESLVTE